VLHAPASNTLGFLSEDTCAFQHSWKKSWVDLEQRESISTLKDLCCRKYYLQKLPQFSQGNNVLDASASKADGLLLKGMCVTATQLNRDIWNKESLSPPWKT
jgi:hypothetical protein